MTEVLQIFYWIVINMYYKSVSPILFWFRMLLFYDNDDEFTDNKEGIKSEETTIINTIKIKYEDKYKDKLQKISNEYIFTEHDLKEYSMEELITKKKNNLKTSVIIEYTPVGNVLMFYNSKREVFEYYSDNSIPNRYLEAVCRKYVITYNCRPLYVNIDDELKKSENKQKEKAINDAILATAKNEKKTSVDEPKKNVFAKFKNYNKEAGTGRVNMNAPPKNSIPNAQNNTNKNDGPILLKEKCNIFSYQGKIREFPMGGKVDKKVANSKQSLSFADFKKLSCLTKK